jgi:hypothetical protein
MMVKVLGFLLFNVGRLVQQKQFFYTYVALSALTFDLPSWLAWTFKRGQPDFRYLKRFLSFFLVADVLAISVIL